jgi:hypothetical protein
MPFRVPLLALAAGVVLASGSLSTAVAAPAPAPPCHPFSSGFKSWISFHTVAVTCADAHTLAKAWSSSCGRSSRPSETLHCTLSTATYGPFNCASHKGSQSPDHYIVECGARYHRVHFTHYPHGF